MRGAPYDIEHRIQVGNGTKLGRERTADLKQKNGELTRMNRLFVGRKLRMIELKERIRELEIKSGGTGDHSVRR